LKNGWFHAGILPLSRTRRNHFGRLQLVDHPHHDLVFAQRAANDDFTRARDK